MILSEIKLLLIFVVRFVEGYFHTAITRYIIKTLISVKEIPMWNWFRWSFISGLGWKGFAGLAVIGSFTLITFPLGMWISSFDAGLFYPLSNLYSTIMGMFLIPLNIWTFNKTVHEIPFNRATIMGIVVLEVSSLITIVGWYLIYAGSKGV